MNSQEPQRIHDASLQILEEIGVRLEHDSVIDRVIKAGARPGPEPQCVRFPRKMVDEYLAMAPSVVRLDDRQGLGHTLTANSRSIFWTNPGLNIHSGDGVREVESRDLADVARLCDHLPNIHGVMGMAVADVAPVHRDFAGVRIIAENTRKHVRALCFTPTGMEAIGEMKDVFPGNWLSIGFTAHGPLRWTHLALDIFSKSAGRGIPVTINGEPMAGKHLWIPGLLNRKTREGCHQTLGERAESRAREILDADKEPKIGADERKTLKKIEEKFKKQINA